MIGEEWGIRKSSKRYKIHCPSHVACANALYSTSEDKLETIDCFLIFQLMSDVPKKKQKHVADLFVSGQAPQSN